MGPRQTEQSAVRGIARVWLRDWPAAVYGLCRLPRLNAAELPSPTWSRLKSLFSLLRENNALSGHDGQCLCCVVSRSFYEVP
jgi:hypothetical protein